MVFRIEAEREVQGFEEKENFQFQVRDLCRELNTGEFVILTVVILGGISSRGEEQLWLWNYFQIL